MHLTRYEQETIILMNAGDKEATVYTVDHTVKRKLDTLARSYPDIYRIVSEDDVSKTYTMPKTHVTYRKPRILTEDKREQARNMMKEINRRASTE